MSEQAAAQETRSDATPPDATQQAAAEAPKPVDPFANGFADYQGVLAPIPGPNPCGDGRAARYESQWEQIEMEISKLISTEKDVVVDWSRVKDLSEQYLKDKAIDLLVASYFCFSLYVKHGFTGLCSGLATLVAFFDQYWDGMFPPANRITGRIAAMNWLSERLEKALVKHKTDAADMRNLPTLSAQWEIFNKKLTERFPDNTPAFDFLETAVNRMLTEQRNSQRAAEEKHKQQQQAQAPKTGGAPAPELPNAIASEQEVTGAIVPVSKTLSMIAKYYRDADLKNPKAYYFNRCAGWFGILVEPPDTGGRTGMGGPSKNDVDQYRQWITAGHHKEVVKVLEERLVRFPFWLTSQRWICESLDKLGSDYMACKKTVVDQLSLLVRRLPKLAELKFADDTVFADDETKAWLAEIGQSGGGGGGMVLQADDGEAPWLTVYNEAKALAGQGKMAEALTLFKEGQGQAGSRRENFFWRIYQSRFTQEAGQLELAIGQLQSLDAQARQFGLDEWEPKLSVEVARLLLQCYSKYLKKSKKNIPELGVKMEELYRRICQLDINVALAIEDKPWQA